MKSIRPFNIPCCLRRLCLFLVLPLAFAQGAEPAAASRPNVLLIIDDDLNDLVGCMTPEVGTKTPNIDRLASQGTLFVNAHCAAPVCNPSRTAMLTGLSPSTTGIYDNLQVPSPPDHIVFKTVLLPGHFKNNGYRVIGAGKIPGHSTGAYKWDDTFIPNTKGRVKGGGNHTWGIAAEAKEDLPDWQMADWAAGQLARPQQKPLFLAIGFVKPHLPWTVPKEYFDRFPAGSVKPVPLKADDTADLPAAAHGETSRAVSRLIEKRDEAHTAYFAAMAFADECIGRVIAALERSPIRDNTIIVLCGDNGFQIGEKNSFGKGRLWEESTHVPLMIKLPGSSKTQCCTRPVSLLDVYPTLIDICALPAISGLEGTSLTPLLKNPTAEWKSAAVTTMGEGNHTVRTERWRYIRYAEGSEELYNHESDPHEWTNLASNPEFESIKTELRRHLPANNAPRNPAQSKARGNE
jgi:arylsulfatase A-like enzyme